MTSGSDRKLALTGVGWLYGLLPAKREKAWRVPVSPTLQTFVALFISAQVEVFSGATNADFLGLLLCISMFIFVVVKL